MGHQFTSANAREMGALGIAARRRLLADRKECVQRLRDLEARFDAALIESRDRQTAIDADFRERRLRRTRRQIEKLADAIDQAITDGDFAEVGRLATAQATLSEQEFALAGRPKPKAADVSPTGPAARGVDVPRRPRFTET